MAYAADNAMPVKILVDEHHTINAIVSVPRVSVEIIANLMRQDDTIKLEGVHVELLTGGPLDRRNVDLLCAEFCRHYQVGALVIEGARRTTGRSAGRMPRVIKYKVLK